MTVKQARAKRRLSRAALAKQSGVNRSTVARIEDGEVMPLHETVTAMEAALRVKPGTLVFHSEASR